MDALGEHLSSGRIDLDEFGTRSAQINQARTVADLRALFLDLPAPHPVLPDGGGPVAARVRTAAPTVPHAASPVGRPPDGVSPAQRIAAAVVGASGIIALVLFLAFNLPWYIFLLPALIGVVTNAVWGKGWRGRR